MSLDRTKPPPGWRCYRADDGVYQCHPSQIAGWPKDVGTLCGSKPEPLIAKAWAAMDAVATLLGLVEPAHDWLQRVKPGTETGNAEWRLRSRDGVLYKCSYHDNDWQPTDDPALLRYYAQMTRADFSPIELGVLGQLLQSPECPALDAWHRELVDRAIAAELRALAAKYRGREIDVEAGDFNTCTSLDFVADELEARADELDPPPDEPRPPRTAVREFHGRMPKR